MTSDKEWAQRRHANRRASQRFDLHMTDNDHREMRAMIHDGKTICLEKQSHRVKVHGIYYKDTLCKVVYDSQRKSIVTFLHLDPVEEIIVRRRFGLAPPESCACAKPIIGEFALRCAACGKAFKQQEKKDV